MFILNSAGYTVNFKKEIKLRVAYNCEVIGGLLYNLAEDSELFFILEDIMPKRRPFPPTTYAMWRKYVLERDNYICQECDKKNSRNAHHIKSYIKYPTLRLKVSNGITLCKKCHKNKHKKNKSI